jgi:putative oxidoreductase
MLGWLIRTDNDLGALLARLTLGAVMFPHGAQKVLGWWGGHGLQATVTSFTEQMGLPGPVAGLVIAAEFLGSIGLILGFLSRLGALGIGAVMVGAIVKVHLAHGFFMNWFGTQAGEGFEYHLLAIGLALVVLVKGSGALSLDGLLSVNRPPDHTL